MNNDELIAWIKQQSKLLYPDFFDDERQSEVLDPLINTAITFIGNRKQELINKDKLMYQQIMLYIVLMLMWQIDNADGVPTAAKAGSVDVELANANNPFANMLKMFLETIGWNTWKVRFM